MTERISHSEAETISIGRVFAMNLKAGDVVLLSGPLGAGKTAFVRGMAEGLGCDLEGVSSPSFTIVQEYAGPIRLQHVDLYRLSPPEVEELALDDLLEGAVMAIEWPDRWHDAPDEAQLVTIEPTGEATRRVTISSA